MKNIIKILLIMILVFSSLKANAVILSSSEIKAAISKQVQANYKKYTDAKTEANIVALPFDTLSVPDGKISFVVTQSIDKFMARDLVKVSVYSDNKLIKTFNAPVVVKAYQNVLVASCYIEREKELDYNIVKIEKKEIADHFEQYLRPESMNNHIVTKKVFAKGEVIDKRFIKLRPDVLRNANVTVLFDNSNLTVTVDAIALTDGIVGDNICIMNKKYNKIYKGTVVGENKVLVKI